MLRASAVFFGCALAGSSIAIAATSVRVAETSNANQCTEQGFKMTWWECYDGTKGRSGSETTCWSSDMWRTKAEAACKDRCSRETGKCGVNSFNVDGSCNSCAKTSTDPTTTTIPQCPDVTVGIDECQKRGLGYEKVMKEGCTRIVCVQSDTDRCAFERKQVEQKVNECKRMGGTPLLKVENNCSVFDQCVHSEQSSTVTCKKWTDGGCVKMSCDDGSEWNSCRQGSSGDMKKMQPTQVPKENTGAKPQTVPPKTTTTDAPKPTVTCKSYVEKNCRVRVCSDGKRTSTCANPTPSTR